MGHDCTGHIYIGHSYMGHDCIGHSYRGHNYIGHTCTGHNNVPDPGSLSVAAGMPGIEARRKTKISGLCQMVAAP